MQVKLALPKGRLMASTAAMLDKIGLCLDEYNKGSRSYRPVCQRYPGLEIKVFQEKDIPIQVAVGNYDLGICGLDWIEELLAKFPASSIVKVKNLGYSVSHLHLVAGNDKPAPSIQDLSRFNGEIRLASEYPNLAEAFALRLRLKRFQVFPLWGSAEAYPPDSAEIAIISGNGVIPPGLSSVASILTSSAFLIANCDSWKSKDMAELLAIIEQASGVKEPAISGETTSTSVEEYSFPHSGRSLLRLALPDGHQQPPTLEFLSQAGLKIQGYGTAGVYRPSIDLPGVSVKVIRPQDMPLQVACGNFDLAITGQDWLLDHLSRFPTSPVKELVRLDFGKVRVVAVVPEGLPVETGQQLRGLVQNGHFRRLRVASEYVNIADKYARDNHLGHYQVIPTWGASEAFLPEDADLLIENTQTGRTLAENKLKIIDTILESQACLIGRMNGLMPTEAQSVINSLIDRFHGILGR